MPRSGWIALGAVVASLALETAVGYRGAAAVGLLAMAIVVAGWWLHGARTHHGGSRIGGGGGAVALTGIGALVIAARALFAPVASPAPTGLPLPEGEGPWVATVLTIGAPRAGEQPITAELDLPGRLDVAATLPVYPIVVPGDRVAMSGSLRPPPADDPYGAYLARIGVSATIRATTVTVETPSDDLGRRLEGLRRNADSALRAALPEPEAGLASGILVGLRDRVDRDLTAAFTAVGATHVVAISGWNIAIVASTLAAVAGRLARRRRMALTALAIVAYVAFVGPSPSVVRAAGMAAVVMAARELGRPSRAAAAIGWAVAGLLVVNPGLVEDAGFRLSALATVGLIAWGTALTERLAGPGPGRVRAWLAESLGVSLAAQLATLPIVVLSFGRLSLVAPVVNLGVVPLVAPAMGAGAVALGGGLLAQAGLPAAVATVVGLPAWVLFSAIVWLVRTGASVPFASFRLAPPWDAAVAAMAGVGILVTSAALRGRRGRRARNELQAERQPEVERQRAAPTAPSASKRMTTTPSNSLRGRRPVAGPWWQARGARWIAGGLAASVVALAIVAVHRPDGIPRITVLDVGQGDAILVEGGRGGRMLIDGGPDPGRLLIALDEHLPPWDRRIDLVILSHPHEDHAAGLAALLDRYGVGRVLEPGMIGPGPGYAAMNAELIARGIARGTLATGDRLAVDDIRFRVLWPDPGSVPERPSDGGTGINNVSIVLLGEVDGHRILLAGDIEQQIDPKILARGLPRVDFLKVAHHGSRTSSTAPFLAVVQPTVAVISAGRGNPYGHPAPATVDRLEAAGARVLRTDDDGSVTVDVGPGPLHLRTSGARTASASLAAATAPAFLCGIPYVAPSAPFAAVRTAPTVPSDAPARIAPLASVRPFPPLLPPGSDAANGLGYASPRDHPDDSPQAIPSGLPLAVPVRVGLVRRRPRAGRWRRPAGEWRSIAA